MRTQHTAAIVDAADLFSRSDAAAFARCSVDTIERALDAGALRFQRLRCGIRLITRSDLSTWCEDRARRRSLRRGARVTT